MLIYVLVFPVALLCGFGVAYGTGIFMGPQKASELPGGSIGIGVLATVPLWPHSVAFVALGAILGLCGWAVYKLVVARQIRG